ncbi:MAG: 4-hydroxy-tetrahydrodipicolinate synthase [Acidobacteria bacterium]|nr:4-hydroxy-tetrahydrodipicolinate synthase [Acidobacteriota bacterium]
MTHGADWLRGCATALVTPFTADGALDERRAHELAVRQVRGGVRLLVPCGTTGESVTLSPAEREAVIAASVRAARGRARVIAGTGSNSTAATVEQSRRARELGADAVLIVAPYYNKPTQEGLYQHFRAAAKAVAPLPVVVYNVPGRTASNISAETTLRLARGVKNVVAVKEASGNFAQIMEILRGRPAGFLVLSGDDSLTLPMIALGADGLISVASNEAPREMSKMIESALSGDWDGARRLHYRLLPLMDVNFVETSPGPVKAAMAMMGLLEESLRLPLVPVSDATRARVREVLVEMGMAKKARKKNVAAKADRGAGRARR